MKKAFLIFALGGALASAGFSQAKNADDLFFKEYETIKTHPVIGSDSLKSISSMPEISIGARSHHERYDGKGYPDGLAGENIPWLAHIIGVADAYDAMIKLIDEDTGYTMHE